MGDLNSLNSSPSTSGIIVETSLSGEYDVFLSFCGKDTRYGFIDFLYTYLQGAGVCTFRDDNELRPGEEIGPELTKAIENSKIYIPIFSSNYAFSKWCLLELAHVVKCHAEAHGGKMIFPIFHDIEPHDVRHQSGSYEEAFRQHEKKKRLEVQTIQIWKEALAKVGGLKGLELKKETGGREGELVKQTVEHCLRFLKKDHQDVPSDMVGMENHIRNLKSLLEVDSSEVRIVGIHGMGGLGKTTMAKIIYNQLCQHFEGHCFLENIRENSNPRRKIVNLQSQLISKIQNRHAEQFTDFNEGYRRIKEAVRGRKLLIVLDDADEKFEVDMLIGKESWFGVRSRIIITTRNKSVLNSIEKACQREDLHYVYSSYEPELMDELHSLQLFSKYAFRRDFPFKEYNSLSKEVVSIAAGLPLVLVVLGSTFYEVEGIDLWEEDVRKLRKIPNPKVLETLKFSFDALTSEQKEIFLDIACLFIGENEQICRYMWDDCEYFPKGGIDVLISRSLITIGSENEFKMHDQLRDLGRHIVDEESLKELGKRSRLWRAEEAIDVLETKQGTSFINALCLSKYYRRKSLSVPLSRNMWHSFMSLLGFSFHDKRQPPLPGSCFQDLANLRYLRLSSADINGDFTDLLLKLRWLRWECVGKFIPKNLHMENLVVLNLSHSSFKDNWKGWNQINFGKKLKHLDLSFCRRIRVFGHFSMCTSLESLNLSYSSVCRLDGLGVFKALKYFNASSCKDLETLSGLEKLESLQDLNIKWCTSLRRLPDLSNLKMLKYLNASWCYSLETLSDLSNVTMLVKLNLNDCKNLREIQGLEKLESLQDLSIAYCDSLTRLPDLSNLKMLKYLNASGCLSLETLSDLSNVAKLVKLHLEDCENLREIQGLEKLESLQDLSIEGCTSLRRLTNFSNLKMLKYLNASLCYSLETLSDLSNVAKLVKLHLEDCENLREIQGLEKLESLQDLSICGCTSLRRLPDLSNLKMLKKFDGSCCDKLVEIGGLEKLESLETLNFSVCNSLERLPNFFKLKNLKRFDAQGCSKLILVEGLLQLNALEHLDLRGCLSLKYAADISNLNNLMSLGVCGLEFQQVKGACFTKLKDLRIHACDKIQLPCGLELLETLHISSCIKLIKIEGLHKLQSLICLSVEYCPSLESLSDLPNFGTLKEIKVQYCDKLHDVDGLGVVESLEILSISNCDVLREIPYLRSWKCLKKLEIKDLLELAEVHGLEELKSLESLKIRGCCSMNMSNIKEYKKLVDYGRVDMCKFDVQGLEESNGFLHNWNINFHRLFPFFCCTFYCQ